MTKSMAHLEAEKMNAVESYLLNEMTEEQRMRFEEHYFECATCADAVEAGQAFISGIRPVEETVHWWEKPVPVWRVWALGGATIALLALTTMREFQSAPAVMANTIIQAEEIMRGPDRAYRPVTPSVTVEAPIVDASDHPFYQVVITGTDSGKRFSQIVPSPAKGEVWLSVQMERAVLGSGRFEVTVAGLDSRDAKQPQSAATYYFQIDKN